MPERGWFEERRSRAKFEREREQHKRLWGRSVFNSLEEQDAFRERYSAVRARGARLAAQEADSLSFRRRLAAQTLERTSTWTGQSGKFSRAAQHRPCALELAALAAGVTL
jgi:hypothetical protein